MRTNRRNVGRGRTRRGPAKKRRHTAATRARHRAATRRRDRVATIRKAQAISDQIRRDRMNRYLTARNDPYGRHGQKWDEAGYDMYD
jgi:hypothetical protein